MVDSMAILNTLQTKNFCPQPDGETFDLSNGETYQDRMVRVIMSDDDIHVLLMTGNQVEIWGAVLRNPPLTIATSVIGLAVAEAKL